MKGEWRAGPVVGEGGALRARASSTPPSLTPPARDAHVIWHEVECGGYAADLDLWEELASASEGPVLELGCGPGRVCSHLQRRGHDVCGLDSDPELIEHLANAELGDAREFDLDRRFGLMLAPMQLVQLFAGAKERRSCLRCVAAHLAPGGLAAFAIVESMPKPSDNASPLPDTREVDGWVYSSLPVDTQVDDDAIRVRRLRQTVSPQGEFAEELYEVALSTLSAGTLEAEASDAGLIPAGRREIAPTDAHVGSTVVLLGREI
jgi:SAM-dependent methyltransferase